MSILIRILGKLVRWIAYAVVAILLLAIAAVLVIGLVPSATGYAVDQMAKIASTPDRTIAIAAPSGLLNGNLRVGSITVSDTKGPYAKVQNLAIDWSPLSLLTGTFHADRVAADVVDFERLPVSTAAPAPATEPASSSGFSLPIAIDIGAIALPDLRIGQAVAGQDFVLAADGSVKANSSSMGLTLNAFRHDVPDAKLSADIAFAPADNQLKLKTQISEPRDGMLAGLLHLPGGPAVNIDLSGDGPLSNWAGKLQAALDGKPTVAITGHHSLSADGLHHIDVKGGGDVDSLLPPTLRALFAGQTTIDLSAAFDGKGKIDIQTGNLATGSAVLAASGTLDPAGNNSLNANLIGTSGPVDFRWPMENGEARALISRVDIALTGAAQSVKIDAKAALDSASTPQGNIGQINLGARSDAFNLTAMSGPLQLRLVVGQTAFVSPDLNRLIRAPIALTAPLQLSPDTIGFNNTTLESASIGGTINGKYTLSSKALTGNFKLFALPGVLPDGVSNKFEGTISLEGQVAGTVPTKMTLSNLAVKSNVAEINGNVALNDQSLTSDLSGKVLDLSKLVPNAQGQADIGLKAKGPLSALGIDATVKAVNVKLAGRLLDTLDIGVTGTADPKAPQAKVQASGAIDGKPIRITADAVSKDGRTSIPSLAAEIGTNKLQGKLDLSPSFEPTGALTFDLPDLSLLAALAGQKAEGDLKGSLDIASANGKTGLKVNANGNGIRRDDLVISKPAVALAVDDLKAFSANGSIRADTIASGANRIADLNLTFTQQGSRTDFDLKSAYDNAPLTTRGSVETAGGQTTVNLDSFAGAPRTIPVKLASPTKIVIKDGIASLNGLTLQTGGGSVIIDGTAGQALNINAKIANLPASLANVFAPTLAAEGVISGTVAVTGKAASPSVIFQTNWSGAATSQTKSAGLAALGIKADGKFADNVVTINTNLTGQSGLALNGGGTIAIAGNKAMALRFSGNLPFDALAGQLAAQGLVMTGTAKIDMQIGGTTAAPAITGSITTDSAKLVDVRRNLTLNGLAVTVTLDGRQAVISRLSGNLTSGGSISGSGTVGIAPDSGFPADIQMKFNNATYVDGTLVTAMVNGTLGIKGPLMTAPMLTGNLRISKASITVPQKLPASLSEINIKHKNAPAAVKAQFKDQKPEAPRSKSATLGIDLQLDAPSQIFVRGRGIDAELGGNITVRGTAAEPVVSGGFTMRRGRLTILSRRLDFTDTSKITFGGDLTPALNMEATSTAGSTTITVDVTGLATDPQIGFSSSPALPQDEVLAQLIFGQSISKLSAMQIAQLADAASQLAGGRSTSLFEGLRSHLGVDDLDISTDANGQAQVGAGKYINKRTYIELQQGASNNTKAIINFNVGRGVKLRGAAGSDGAGEAGVVYEHEY
ncbi:MULTISPECIES: translocation/assembly module TamB domain-containing protein [unclassified Rhizobium]|uniref:translocation/assembly module TamB domain-containing protein n=1 Tax=unclassified Rhizobium TaxID=2613769 RepID=UPI001610C8DC|nr:MULTISPECIES: translocation/assembly module TamB domain-containing protein [unclassified Rhizobium]MBB3385808.1 translocation and assembly module TamB [Rhizobium sp. BK098]MBB3617513.1 translocation and assembly module TamB [Rhizobium sp. BK609]MBB3683224.1 translocation and assembly module TamB [Rhizobium sp. BK612]